MDFGGRVMAKKTFTPEQVVFKLHELDVIIGMISLPISVNHSFRRASFLLANNDYSECLDE